LSGLTTLPGPPGGYRLVSCAIRRPVQG